MILKKEWCQNGENRRGLLLHCFRIYSLPVGCTCECTRAHSNARTHTHARTKTLKSLMLFWRSHSSAKFMSNNNLWDDKIQTLSRTTERSRSALLYECQRMTRKKKGGQMNIFMLLRWQNEFQSCRCNVPVTPVRVEMCCQAQNKSIPTLIGINRWVSIVRTQCLKEMETNV